MIRKFSHGTSVVDCGTCHVTRPGQSSGPDNSHEADLVTRVLRVFKGQQAPSVSTDDLDVLTSDMGDM